MNRIFGRVLVKNFLEFKPGHLLYIGHLIVLECSLCEDSSAG